MKFKKMLTIGGVLLMSAVMLAGCGNSKKEAADDGKTTIRISWWGGDDRHEATLAAIKAFEKENPDIKVKAEYSGWDGVEQKMATQITGKTEPDVMQVNYDWIAQYSPTGEGFADLSTLDGLDLSGYDETTLESGKVNGLLNAVPFSENARVWCINPKAFEERGVEIPTTWDEYIEAADKFEDGAFPARIDTYALLTYMQQKTGKTILAEDGTFQYDKATVKEAFDWYKGLIDKGVIPTIQETKEQADANPGAPAKKLLDGQYGNLTTWSAQVSGEYKNMEEAGQELALINFPTLTKDGEQVVINKPSMLFAVSKNSKNQEAAAKLLNFLLNEPEGVKAMSLARGVPANQTAFDILEADGQVTGIDKDVHEYVQNTEGITFSKYTEMSKVMQAYNDAFDEFSYGKIDSSEAAQRTIDGMTEAVEQVKSTIE
ncbi:oligogalacturonide transport system substrate-binding protein [Enterococcus sp. PF1-24]|uniref:ABC transporter substrate-binding protein n=1 Tax=unclassified Enterococcus TaxID=2608891 RepID=UPI0024769A6F|nr:MULTISPECIES: ABC transporter substrate-binding protein [unclassified Enterococcus]MDH6363996.1 oligogalacturonide transport system substrate-binding protein [Enterococcus sp. PFB1-1]MDH6401097.1 oligogalacturonide transport system substrate-binding protein [Enterococcus sp. PF1-24]